MKRPAVWILIFMMCGIYCRLGVSEMICAVCFILPLVLLSCLVTKMRRKRYILMGLAMPLGMALASAAALPSFAEFHENGVYVTGSGYITEVGQTSGGYPKLGVLADVTETESGITHETVSLYLIDLQKGTHSVGEGVFLEGDALAFEHADLHGGYDEWMYLKASGYDAKMFPERLEKTGEFYVTAKTVLAGWNEEIQKVVENILPPEESAIAKALITGDRDDIASGTEDLYTRAGVTHILSISGLHMSLLALYVSYILEYILRCSKRICAAVTMGVCIFFLMLTGFVPPSVRAVIMICIALLGKIVYRKHDGWNSIAVAALILLCVEPLYLWNAGFQLSFLSLMGIYAGMVLLPSGKTWLGKCGNLAGMSAFATLFSMPVVAYHFGYCSTVGILANMVILPLSGILLGCTMLAALAGFFWLQAGVFLSGIVYVILQIYELICVLVTQLPYSYFTLGKPSVEMVLMCYVLIYALCFYKPCLTNRLMVGCALTCIWCSMCANALFLHRNEIAFLDVGQGDCTVITTYRNQAIVIDGGGVYGKELGENTGVTVLEPYLTAKGITEVEAVFLTHLDADHSSGILELLSDMPVNGVYLPEGEAVELEMQQLLQEIVEKNQIPVYTVKQGDSVGMTAFGTMECLHPGEGQIWKSENTRSLVLKYTYGNTSVLLTGDVEGMQELQILQRGTDVRADILKVAHHGSRTSSQPSFLDAVDPEMAVISCGDQNLYGHPHLQTLEKLSERNVEIFRTDQMGSIRVTLLPEEGYSVETAVERKPFYERIKEAMEAT